MKRIITIGREFGSGGREVGRRLAERLNIAYYDREIIDELMKRTQLAESYVLQVEESIYFISKAIFESLSEIHIRFMRIERPV